MNKAISAALLIVGVILIMHGVNASNSLSSDISRFFTGSPNDRTFWFLLGGVFAGCIGLFGLMRGSKK